MQCQFIVNNYGEDPGRNHTMSKRLFISSLTAAFSAGTAFGLYLDHVITSDDVCAIQKAEVFPNQSTNITHAASPIEVEKQFRDFPPLASDSWPDKTVPKDEFNDREWIYMAPEPD
jgi:hypothetical protein